MVEPGPVPLDEAPSAPPRLRANALDALRGLAIFGMALSGMIPFGILPNWMYHAQVPPPDHKFNPAIPGITWVDLVFPIFLFSMGAAIPMALDARLRKGETTIRCVGGLFWRFLVLAGFAIYLQNTRPPLVKTTPAEWTSALIALGLLFPLMMRFPTAWSQRLVAGIRVAGLAGCAYFVSQFANRDGKPFNWESNDIILLVLANVALVGGLIYLFTRDKPWVRLGFIAFWTAIVIARLEPGWVKEAFAWREPIKWVYNAEFLKYLLLVLPATFVGEAILRSVRPASEDSPDDEPVVAYWRPSRLLVIAALGVALTVGVTAGLFFRYVGWTVACVGITSAILLWLTNTAESELDRALQTIVRIGLFLLVVGLAFEPFQGGIKKDSATLSYFFVTGGLGSLTLVALMILMDRFSGGWLRPMSLLGQNAILGYVLITHAMPWLWKGLGAELWFVERFGVEPGPGFMRGLCEAALFVAIAAIAARFKVTFRA